MNSNAQTAGCPDAVVDWIAWYDEGLLPEAARGRIEAHAAECPRCRHELAMLRGDEEPQVRDMPDPEAVFGQVLARIEAESVERSARTAAERSARPERRAPARPGRKGKSLRLRTMGLAASVALVAGALGAFVTLQLDEPSYRPASVAAESEARIDAVFHRDAPYGRIEASLRSVGGSIVSGPTAGGRVGIALPDGADPNAVATRLREQLGADALLVEPSLR
ncbi:MAG: zf-HC2 domain-containing protein [Myxococcota bacterium]|nr:zf-HC2 domain-containing protein [Myxococcota bacterium]